MSLLRKTTLSTLLLLLAALPSLAQVRDADVNELKAELAKLKAIVAEQQSKLDQLAKPQSQATVPVSALKDSVAPSKGIQAGWDNNRPTLRSANGDFQANLGGFVHFDARTYTAGTHPPNTFLVRRARLFLDGKVMKYFDYKLEGDFVDTSSTLLRDGWVRVHRWEPLQFQIGHFKEPFSQEELRSDQAQDFVERSMANTLAPSRSPGIMVLGSIKNGLFEYQAGVFNGKGLLNLNTNNTPESVVRVRYTPAKASKNTWLNAFSFGAAFAIGRNNAGATSFKGQTESRSITFFAPVKVNGSLYRANGELTYVKGPFAVRAEYDHVSQKRVGLGVGGTDLVPVDSNAFSGQVTYLVTGEKKPDNGAVVPKRSLFGEEHGLGALELKFRYAFLDVNDHTANANRANSFFFGTNWYWNRFAKNLTEVGIETYRDPVRTPNPGDRKYFVILNRVQFAF